ncbi:Os02g0328000 [Oryza sativa Japonica Group]|uniref:Os02g0328000 protein n=1 Tax=Oryza sativa subsp. japonica TaxID=39947 RepID=A0A0P0VID0_ORYSJ|nr:hypothetical protein DAI22_02g148600 [Oryza sativa Japonica Group]BAS78422.1 Os02g0328000 [Oryza sativa Japonica Group]
MPDGYPLGLPAMLRRAAGRRSCAAASPVTARAAALLAAACAAVRARGPLRSQPRASRLPPSCTASSPTTAPPPASPQPPPALVHHHVARHCPAASHLVASHRRTATPRCQPPPGYFPCAAAA